MIVLFSSRYGILMIESNEGIRRSFHVVLIDLTLTKRGPLSGAYAIPMQAIPVQSLLISSFQIVVTKVLLLSDWMNK